MNLVLKMMDGITFIGVEYQSQYRYFLMGAFLAHFFLGVLILHHNLDMIFMCIYI